MTADIVNNFPLRPMKTPFAGTALISANTSSVGGVNVSTLPATGENVANVATGFPETFSTSITNGGKYIKRADVNAMGYIATIMAFRQQMGMPNEWNSQICNAIGGYPKGAVLDYCVRNGSVITETYKITSLVDDNTENPTSIAQSNWTKWARVSINADYVDSHKAYRSWYENEEFYRIYSDGWCEQGGCINIKIGAIYSVKVSLHIRMKSKRYNILLTTSDMKYGRDNYSGTVNAAEVGWGNRSETEFYFGVEHGWNTPQTVCWRVYGFAS